MTDRTSQDALFDAPAAAAPGAGAHRTAPRRAEPTVRGGAGDGLFDASAMVRARPVLKWPGGKRHMAGRVAHAARRAGFTRYVEPFAGGLAVFFELSPENGSVGDTNPSLVNLYRVLAAHADELVSELRSPYWSNTEERFYEARGLDPAALTPVQAAARTVYLNRTCFNGLHRVNAAGLFNAAYGFYPDVGFDADNLRAAGRALARATIDQADFRDVLEQRAEPGSFVFLDPPYLPTSGTANFVRYSAGGFGADDHRDLAAWFGRLADDGCTVVLTNSDHPLVHELYAGHAIFAVAAARTINVDPAGRTGTDAVVVAGPGAQHLTGARKA